jgi:hypothetical protein
MLTCTEKGPTYRFSPAKASHFPLDQVSHLRELNQWLHQPTVIRYEVGLGGVELRALSQCLNHKQAHAVSECAA